MHQFQAVEVTQVTESIPWVRCASGNVYTTRCIPKCKYICLYIHLFVKLYNTGHQTGHLSHCAVSIAELILVCGFPSTAGNNKQSPHVVFFTQITKLHCNPPQHVFF